MFFVEFFVNKILGIIKFIFIIYIMYVLEFVVEL